MKKLLLVFTAILMVLSFSACGAIRDKVVDVVKSAVANASLAPEESVEPELTEEAQETAAPVESTEPEESAAAEETEEPGNIDIGDGLSPDELPAFVPKFQYGEFIEKDSGKLEYNGSAVYTMNFSGVEKKNLEEYKDALIAAGYADTVITEYDGGVMIAGNYKKDDVESAALVTLNTKDGTCIYILTIVAKE